MGPVADLVSGAEYLISLGEEMLKKCLEQGDEKRTQEHATRLARASFVADQIFRRELCNSESRLRITAEQKNAYLNEITGALLSDQSLELIEDIQPLLESLFIDQWGGHEIDTELLKPCFTELLNFTYTATRFMTEKEGGETCKEIHRRAVDSTVNLLKTMISTAITDKNEEYQTRLKESAKTFRRQHNIAMLVNLLQHAPEGPPITRHEIGTALPAIPGLEEWFTSQGEKFLEIYREEGLSRADENRFFTAIVAIGKDEDFQEVFWPAFDNRSFGRLVFISYSSADHGF